MLKKWILAIAVLAILVPAAQAQDELQALKAQVRAQEKSIAQMKQQINAVQRQNASAGGDNWWDRLTWSGDFRFRSEFLNDEDTSNNVKGNRNYNRVRARIKMDAKVNEEVDVTVRLASGSSSATSTNQTLTSQESSKDVWLDQMFMTYSPEAIEGFEALAGKMANPFLRVGGNQLIWDSDVTPEGVAFSSTTKLSEETSVNVTGGGIWLTENWSGPAATNASDEYLVAIQAHIKQVLDATSSLTAGVSYYDFVNVQNSPNYDTGGNSGNSLSGGNLANDYNLLEFFAALDTEINGLPLCVFGTYVNNGGTESGYNQDTAWLAGVNLNKLKDPGSWQAKYEYRDVEADAVLGALTDADPVGGGTTGLTAGGLGSSGHRFGFGYQAMKNVVLAATYLISEQEAAGVDYDFNKLQLDCIVKFK